MYTFVLASALPAVCSASSVMSLDSGGEARFEVVLAQVITLVQNASFGRSVRRMTYVAQ